jgi:hypothetical protein
VPRGNPEVARENPGQDDTRRENARRDSQRRLERFGNALLARETGDPGDGEKAEDDISRRDLRRQKREEDEEPEEDPIAQRASDPGSASSISITGMSDTIG